MACPNTKGAAIIDPVLDYEPPTFTLNTPSADSLLEILREKGYTVTGLLETHARADHLTAAFYVRGSLWARGHPDLHWGENHDRANVFTVDSILNPDIGSARCDFPSGDTRTLARSMQRLLAFPPDTRLNVAHDYPPSNESASWDSMPYVIVRD